MGLLALLDAGSRRPDDAWWNAVGRSLSGRPSDWVDAVREAGSLDQDQAWALLSWVELAATEVARGGSGSLLESAAFGISLLVASDLDARDVAVVASLLRRGAQIAGIDFGECVGVGCAHAAEFGTAALDRLLSVEASTPATHAEVGEGPSFTFVRRPVDFDVLELERWLEGDG